MRISVYIAKSVVIDTYLFFTNRMIYKIHVCLKRLDMQLIHVYLSLCFKINKTKYKSDQIYEIENK